MGTAHGPLNMLAAAVADGAPVDWDQAESSAETVEDRRLVQQFRQLAAVWAASRTETATWGPFEIREEIGTGTFGTVYRAWDGRLQREVALKLLRSSAHSPLVASSITREGQLLARIRHENVVTVYGADVFDDHVGIWMELVAGRTLKAIVEQQGTLGAQESGLIGRDVCRALAAVHQKGLLHRDVKAQNVMREAGGRIVLMDFGTGIAVAPERGDAPSLCGTPAYLAPEVLAGGAPSVESDLYSVGVLLFYLVSGEFPVVGTSLDDLRNRHARGDRRLLHDVRPELPSAFVSVVDETLSADPAARPRSAGALQRRLEATLVQSEDARKRVSILGRWPTIAAAAIVLMALAGGALYLSPSGDVAGNSVAILPFRDLAATQPEDAFFSDGITDDLIAHLSSLKDLRVISGNSVRRLRDQRKTETEIANELGVASVLDGSVRRFGNRVRIVSRLVDARTGQQLWSESFERDLNDVPAMQSEVARKIAVALKVELSDRSAPAPARSHSQSYEAFSLYSKGRYHWKNRREDGRDLAESIRYYQEAIARDPNYALAYAGLADSYMAQGIYNVVPRSVAYDASERAALKAVELDPGLAEAHAALGYVHKNRFRWSDAESSFRRALELKPNFAEPHHWLSVLFTQQGRFAEALSHINAAIRLDPLSLPARMQLGSALLMSRRYDAARAQFQEVLRSDPGIAVAYRAVSLSYAHEGRYDEALGELEKAAAHMPPSTEDREHKSDTAYLLARAGRTDEALKIRSTLEDRYVRAREPLCANIAAIDVALGRKEPALDWLEKAQTMNDAELSYLRVDPRWDSLRDEPRFRTLLDKLGLPEQ